MEVQKAGDNSNQYQIENITIQQGIDEKRAREIYDEKYSIAKRDFTQEALRIANDRVRQLEEQLIPKIERVDNGLKAFEDPSFQLLLIEAQKSAAATERPADYDLLAELLVHRIERGSDRHVRTGIHKAVEIIEDISDEALQALTVVHSVNCIRPNKGPAFVFLDILNDLFGKVIYSNLPTNEIWVENLDILDAIRINPFGGFTALEDIYIQEANYLISSGFEKGSKEHLNAIELLKKNDLPVSLLIDNELLPGYICLNIPEESSLDHLYLRKNVSGNRKWPLSKEQKEAIKSIKKSYLQDQRLADLVKKAFVENWNKRENLYKLGNWWNNLNISFSITSVGKVLAHANAQRCDKSLPPLN